MRSARTTLLAGVVLVLVCLSIPVPGATKGPAATLMIVPVGDGQVRVLKDKSVVNFYSAFVENHSSRNVRFDIRVYGGAGLKPEILGPVIGVWVEPGVKQRVDFLVKLAAAPMTPQQLIFSLFTDGKPVAVARALFRLR